MFIIKTFSKEARNALKEDRELILASCINKNGKVDSNKVFALVESRADGEMVVNDRAVPEEIGIAFEVARKCLLVKGVYSGNIQFFWYAEELTRWYARSFQGACPTRASDWFQNACLAVYEASNSGAVVTRETVRVTKDALGNSLFYLLCQRTQKLSDTHDDRMVIKDIYGTEDKEPSCVIAYRDRYFADSIREKMLDDEEYTKDLTEVERAILDLLYQRVSERKIAEMLSLSKGTAYRKIKAMKDRFEGVLLQYNARR